MEEKDVTLLAQRVQQLEAQLNDERGRTSRLETEFRKSVRTIQSEIDQSKGSSNTAKFIAPGLFTIISLIAGTFGFTAIQSNTDAISDIEIQEATTSAQLEFLRNDLAANNEKFEDVTRLDGLTQRSLLLVNKLEDETEGQDKAHSQDIEALRRTVFDQEGRIRVLENAD